MAAIGSARRSQFHPNRERVGILRYHGAGRMPTRRVLSRYFGTES